MGEEATLGPGLRTTIGRYRLLGAIGHGGMADVFLAVAEGPVDKLVVIKLLRSSYHGDADLVSMFMDEARIAARLNHPSVVQTFEVGLDMGLPFIAMEFLEGQPLNDIQRRMSKDFPLVASVRVILELLTGLHYAHELKDYDGRPLRIVHRDVNPQNVFVTYDGYVKLMDFGIAKAMDSVTETEIGMFKGKLSYMAPEQLGRGPTDRRSDLFAVGVMLWEAVAGRRMWADVPELEIAKRLDAGALPPLPADLDCPSELIAVVHRALCLDPEGRYPTALALRSDLERASEVLGPPPTPGELGAAVASAFAPERRAIARLIDENARDLGVAAPETERHRSRRPRASEQTRKVTRPPREPKRGLPTARKIARRWIWIGAAAGVAATGGLIGWMLRDPEPTSADASKVRPRPQVPAGLGAVDTRECATVDAPPVSLSGDIEGDAILSCSRRYLLEFETTVRAGATLTIEPGTVLLGDQETRARLVVEPGARLIAKGTPERPIVFTSERPPAEREPGDWGGIIILGNAPINLRDREGNPMQGEVEGLSRMGGDYGGDDPDDDSGVLRYVRIEYSGIEIGPNNEINGLTLAGVGRGTRIDHIQVHSTADDCFEFFGGTVDAHHLICDDPGDDGIDWDLGYTGHLQYVLVRSPRGEHGIEGDNDPGGSQHEPRSAPTVANVTLCGGGQAGPRERYGILVRRRSAGVLDRLVVLGFDAALDLRDPGTEIELTHSTLGPGNLHPVALEESGNRRSGAGANDDDGFDEVALVTAAGNNNRIIAEGDASACPLEPVGPALPPETTPLSPDALEPTTHAGAFPAPEAWHQPWSLDPEQQSRD